MNRPSVARTCAHCNTPIASAKHVAFLNGNAVSAGCIRKIAADQATEATEATLGASSFSRGNGIGAGERRALDRRSRDAAANAKLKADRLAREAESPVMSVRL